MRFVRLSAAAAALCAMTSGVDAARSRLACVDLASTIKQISPESIAESGPGQIPEAVVGIVSARIRVVDSIPNALVVTKSTLSNTFAYGADRPGGYNGGGPRNPAGPWVGLCWPFRDFADGYVPQTPPPPLGNDIGTIQPSTSPVQTLLTGISAESAFSLTNPASFARGLPGNGGSEYVRFFSVDVTSTSPVQRLVTVFLEDVQVRVVLQNEDGRLVTAVQSAADVNLSFQIPAPAGGTLGLAAVAMGLMRRRRR